MAISLSSLRRGSMARPPRVVIHGSHKIGKSTLAASAPSPVFIPCEEGADALDVTAFPLATSEQDVREAIGELATQEHHFGAAVLDTADWLESLIHRGIAVAHGADNIGGNGERGDPLGFGKGYTMAANHWREILEGLDVLRNERNMTVIVLAHSQIKRFDDPMSASYDRYALDLHKESAALLCEWADIIGYLSLRMTVEKTDVGFNKKVSRGKSGGDRVLYLEERPSFIAGNRYGLPDEIMIPRDAPWQALQNELAKVMVHPQEKPKGKQK